MSEVIALQRQPLMVEYLLLDGLNDTDADLKALIDYLRELRVHINIIPYNAIDDATELCGTGRERQREFAAALRAAGFVVSIRYSLGADIAAACGQLVRREIGPARIGHAL
jgi:23S rRNA (adenine2503-C2)-methyltransferase